MRRFRSSWPRCSNRGCSNTRNMYRSTCWFRWRFQERGKVGFNCNRGAVDAICLDQLTGLSYM